MLTRTELMELSICILSLSFLITMIGSLRHSLVFLLEDNQLYVGTSSTYLTSTSGLSCRSTHGEGKNERHKVSLMFSLNCSMYCRPVLVYKVCITIYILHNTVRIWVSCMTARVVTTQFRPVVARPKW